MECKKGNMDHENDTVYKIKGFENMEVIKPSQLFEYFNDEDIVVE